VYPGNETGNLIEVMPGLKKAVKQLGNILAGVECKTTGSVRKLEISGLASDSRQVRPGDFFAAVVGQDFDGHDFIDQAVENGCQAILVNKQRIDTEAIKKSSRVTVVEVDDTREALGFIAANFFGHPDEKLTIIGVTGTNGKTTTSYLIEAILKACGKRPGVIGTVNYRYTDEKETYVEIAAPFTTPEPLALHSLLRQMLDQGITHAVMEVSSHALAQRRLNGLTFDVGIFTNLSRDHLDFHIDMDHYFASKKLLFTDYLKEHGQVVIMLDQSTRLDNCKKDTDNDWGEKLSNELQSFLDPSQKDLSIITCGTAADRDIHPLDFKIDINGISANITTPSGDMSFSTRLVGEFNLRNILCATGIGIALDFDRPCISQGLVDAGDIPGRLERIIPGNDQPNNPAVFVDYAHTPDALKNVVSTIRSLQPKRLICVFGCGGDRDHGKRPLMGSIASQYCDVVLITSDNPRTESPDNILAQIEKGIAGSRHKKREPASTILQNADGKGYDVIEDRRLAIQTAIRFAHADDVILISGKGHEDYQESSTGKIFFDDRIEAAMQLQARAGRQPVWSLKWILQITGGKLLKPTTNEITFNNISTDTRTIRSENLFVALTGPNFDGKTFAKQAVDKGAAGLLLNQPPRPEAPSLDFDPHVPVILVKDSLKSLGDLAAHRRRWNQNLPVIALTGSSGKTTVKEMTASIVGRRYCLLKTEGNYNNLIGLPLTLLRLQPDHEAAVLEMGMNQPGEIARLTEIADPDIACIVNVQEAHLEGLGDIQGVARAKNELFAGLKPDGKAVVNLDDAIVSTLAEELSQEKITFGFCEEALIRASNIQSLGNEGMVFTLHLGNEQRSVTIRALGRHNVSNSLAAAAMAHGLGVNLDDIVDGLSAFSPYDKRACLDELESGLMVLNDSYNANPSSMLAALHTLIDLKKNNRAAAVLGEMLELGPKTIEAHRAIGEAVFQLGIDFLAAYGPHANNMVNGARAAGMDQVNTKAFSNKEDLAGWLMQLESTESISAGDWLLIKGSRGMRMETILELLHSNQKTKTGGH
jgi:murE/murF fusion protein